MTNKEKKSEALEALEKIKEAENAARNMIRDAREGASLKIMQEAQDEAGKIKEKSLKEARAKGRTIRDNLIKKAEREADKIREETRKEKEALLKKGSRVQTETVLKITEELKKWIKEGSL